MEWINVLGLVAGTITSVTFLPQVIKTWKEKNAEGVSLLMFAFATISVIMWLIFGIVKKDIAIIYTNSMVLLLSLIMLYFKIRFKAKP